MLVDVVFDCLEQSMSRGEKIEIRATRPNYPLYPGPFPPDQTPKGTMPADDGFGPHDGDRLEDRAEDASGESEHYPISGPDAGFGHRTLQHDDLLAKNDIFREEHGAGSEDRTQCAQHGLEDFDKHHGEIPTTRRSLDESGQNWGRFNLVPSIFGAQAAIKARTV